MKIVHLVTYSGTDGGAAVAVRRLAKAMQKNSTHSVDILSIDSKKAKPLPKTNLTILANILYSFIEKSLNYFFNPQGSWSSGIIGFNLSKHKVLRDADIVYLHWTGDAFLSIPEIGKILKSGKKVYWVLHDMWAFTGGCHHALGCQKYQIQCEKCNLLNPNCLLDLAKYNFNKKLRCWKSYGNLSIISPSQWLANTAKSSRIFQNLDCDVIPNPIDTEEFAPYNKAICLELLGVTQNSGKTILFVGDYLSSYKGFDILKKALKKIDCTHINLWLLGCDYDEKLAKDLPCQTVFLGRKSDAATLRLVYNATDVLVIPSLAENFPNVVVEAMSCGVPCVGAITGGIPELILHKETGYLFESGNTDDLAGGIVWALEDVNIVGLKEHCRRHILDRCSEKNVYNQHEKLWKK